MIAIAAARDGMKLVIGQDANCVLHRPSQVGRHGWPLVTSSEDLMWALLFPRPLLEANMQFNKRWPMRASGKVGLRIQQSWLLVDPPQNAKRFD